MAGSCPVDVHLHNLTCIVEVIAQVTLVEAPKIGCFFAPDQCNFVSTLATMPLGSKQPLTVSGGEKAFGAEAYCDDSWGIGHSPRPLESSVLWPSHPCCAL